MPAFSVLHTKVLPSSSTASLCPTMDLLALSSSDNVTVMRWLAWQKVFTIQDTDITSNTNTGTNNALTTVKNNNSNWMGQQSSSSTVAKYSQSPSLCWSLDGHYVTLFNGTLNTYHNKYNNGDILPFDYFDTNEFDSNDIDTITSFSASSSSTSPIGVDMVSLDTLNKYRIITSTVPSHIPSKHILNYNLLKPENHTYCCYKPTVSSSSPPLLSSSSLYHSLEHYISPLSKEQYQQLSMEQQRIRHQLKECITLHLTPLYWFNACQPKAFTNVPFESEYQYTALVPSSFTTQYQGLYRTVLSPEPLPPITFNINSTEDTSTSNNFLIWDNDNIGSHLRADSDKNAYGNSNRYAGVISATAVAYGRLPQPPNPEFINRSTDDILSMAPSLASASRVTTLAQAAATVDRLCETLIASSVSSNTSSRNISQSSTSLGGGIRGASTEPSTILGYNDWQLSIFCTILPSLQSYYKLLPSYDTESDICRISEYQKIYLLNPSIFAYLAYGSYPIYRLPIDNSLVLRSSSACDMSSLLFLQFHQQSSNGTGTNGIRLRLYDTQALSTHALHLQHASSIFTFGDSCIRHLVRSIHYMANEWSTAHTAVINAFKKLEENMKKVAVDLDSFARLQLAAYSYYPDSPAPLAVSELYRLLTVGSTSSAIAEWLEVAVDEAALVRLIRTVESNLAALEALSVTHMARSGELCLLAIGDLLRTYGSKDTESQLSMEALGVPQQSLEYLADEISHLLVLVQALRSMAVHTRATYSAVFTYLRILQSYWSNPSSSNANDDEAIANKRDQQAQRRKFIPNLAPQDTQLLRVAFRPNKQANIYRGILLMNKHNHPLPTDIPVRILQELNITSGNGSNLPSSVDNDPLGLGIGLGLNTTNVAPSKKVNDDPLGLGSVFSTTSENSTISPSTTSPVLGGTSDHQSMPDTTVGLTLPQHDMFLNYSLNNLIGEDKYLDQLCRIPMSAYQLTIPFCSLPQHLPSLTAQILQVTNRWESICATPSLILGTATKVSQEWIFAMRNEQLPVSLPIETSIEGAIVRASTLIFDDRGSFSSDQVENNDDSIDCGSNTVVTHNRQPFGFHILLLPIPANVVEILTNGSVNSSVIILFRIAFNPNIHARPIVSACAIELPASVYVISSAYYGPSAGTVAIQRALATETGLGYLPTQSIPSDDNRSFVLLTQDYSAFSTTSVTIPSSFPTTIGILEYRNLSFTSVPNTIDKDATLAWILKNVDRHSYTDVVQRMRTLADIPYTVPMIESMDTRKEGANIYTRQCVLSTFSIQLSTCGPRGVSVVVSNGRHITVIDMADDEKDDEEENDEQIEEDENMVENGEKKENNEEDD